MPFNGSGVFQRLYDWTTDRDAGTKIIADRVDAETDGIAAAINSVVDGGQGFIGPVKGTSGTNTSPAFSFTADTDTGMYRVGADTLGFAVNGVLEGQFEAGYFNAVNGLKIGGVAVTKTAAELNADISDVSFSDIQSGAVQTLGDGFSDDDTQLMTAALIADYVAANGGVGDLVAANNLSDLTSATAARSNLNLGNLATLNTVSNSNWSGADLSIVNGGTGASSAASARINLGLVINTNVQAHDANLPTFPSGITTTKIGYLDGVTSPIQTQLNGKATLASPTLTGIPTAPTASEGTDTTQLATTAFVMANAGGGIDVQEFTLSGTWTKPDGYTWALIQVWAAGGGGGSGDATGSGTYRLGGMGGGGGAFKEVYVLLSDLAATASILVGAGGLGGASVTGSTGNNGSAGGTSWLNQTSPKRLFITVNGGSGGKAGNTSGSIDGANGGKSGAGNLTLDGQDQIIDGGKGSDASAGLGPGGSLLGGGGGSGSNNNQGTALEGGSSQYGGGGGGGGGGYDSGGAKNGGKGGRGFGNNNTDATGASGIADGGDATSPGGGGGGSGSSYNPGDGGDGAAPSGGGGGGGSNYNAGASGDGGAGADGFVRITCF